MTSSHSRGSLCDPTGQDTWHDGDHKPSESDSKKDSSLLLRYLSQMVIVNSILSQTCHCFSTYLNTSGKISVCSRLLELWSGDDPRRVLRHRVHYGSHLSEKLQSPTTAGMQLAAGYRAW
jgi:hypothetical protein